MGRNEKFIKSLRSLFEMIKGGSNKEYIREFLDKLWEDFPNSEDPAIAHDDYMLLFEVDHYLSGTEDLDQLLTSFREREQKWSA